MKYLALVFACILLLSCTQKSTYKKPNWLFGTWKRINTKPDTNTYEIWKSDFSGMGYTLKNNDTVFKEILHIITKNDSLFLRVTDVNETPIFFAITQQTDTSFTAENPTHDFPKTIQYWKSNQQLHAKVSNEEFVIDFVFEKLQ